MLAGALGDHISLPSPGVARWALAALALPLLLVESASGEEVPAANAVRVESSLAGRDEDFDRGYGAIEFGVGVLALPDARVCGGAEAGCDRGDVSLALEAWPLYRHDGRFAVGAGITMALTPVQDVPRTTTTFPRDHSRRYFAVEGIGRYYFVYGRDLDAWLGAITGLVVVSDHFESRSPEAGLPIVGPDSANIATEGLSLGLASGVTFGITDHVQIGGTLRVASWFLPASREVLAFGEEASLSGRVTTINFALTVAHHRR